MKGEAMKIEWGAVHGEIVSVAGDRVVIHADGAEPPGARIETRIVGDGTVVKFKVLGSRQREEGGYVIQARTVDVTREVREKLLVGNASKRS